MMNEDFKNSNRYGAIRELIATKILMEQGYNISIPNIDVRYDLIAERYPVFIRVQVKSLKLKSAKNPNESLSVDTWSINPYTIINGEKRTYSNEDCDVIMGIDLNSNNYAIVPIDKIAGKQEFRLSEHENSNGKDYLNSFEALVQFEKNMEEYVE